MRLSMPPNPPFPLYCGESRVISLMRPVIVGSAPSSSRVTAVAAPVRDELNTGSLWPTTVIVSATAASLSVNVRSVATPRLTVTSFSTSVLNPVSAAVTS